MWCPKCAIAILARSSTASNERTGQWQACCWSWAIGETRLALPMSIVARLEEIDRDAIEMSESSASGPVSRPDAAVGPSGRIVADSRRPPPTDKPLQVVVYTDGGHSVGLVVDRIIDIVDDRRIQRDCARRRHPRVGGDPGARHRSARSAQR